MNGEVLRTADLLALARRRSRRLVGAAAVGALLGAAWMVVAPPTYTSSSLVLVESAANERVTGEAQIAASGAVLGPAATQLGHPGGAVALAKHVTAKRAGFAVVRISAKAQDPSHAQRIAAAVTDAYLRYGAEQSAREGTNSTALLIPRRDNLRQELENVDRRIAELRAQPLLPATAPSPELSVRLPAPQVGILMGERARILEDIGVVEQSIANQLAAARTPHVVLDRPDRPSANAPLRWIGAVALGAAVAAAASLFFLVWRSRRDPRLSAVDQISAACGAPLTAVLPGAAADLDADREQAHYARAADRVTGAAIVGDEVASIALLSVEGDQVGAAAAQRIAKVLLPRPNRTLSVSAAWPVLGDLHPGERVFLVVGSGALTGPTLLAVGGACRDTNLPLAGVLAVESRRAPLAATDEPLARVGG